MTIEGSSPSSSRRTRRRLIQSTLVRCKTPEAAEDGDCLGETEEEDEGEKGRVSGGKGRKRKHNAPRRTPKKCLFANQLSPGKHTNGNVSVVSARSDFFLKVSEKKLMQKQQRDHQEGETCLPLTKIMKSRSVLGKKKALQLKKLEGCVTPPKGLKANCKKGSQLCQTTDIDAQSPHMVPKVCDLRLEAKLASEENARLSAGRQMHPFFSSWKGMKRSQETLEIDDENSEGPLLQLSLSNHCPPFHVFEKDQDDLISFDWKDWNFFEGAVANSRLCCNLECSSFLEGSLKPLKVDTILNCSAKSSLGSEVCNDQLLNRGEVKHVEHPRLSAFSNSVKRKEEGGSLSALDMGLGDDHEQRTSFPPERMAPSSAQCVSWQESSLWTEKYQPEKASEVCGNSELVSSLNAWLQSWCDRVPRVSVIHNEHSWSGSESESEDMDVETDLKNVFLITGPVGSGKSAAIYACAKEKGFEVIEVSASDCRNGATVKQKFGEAMKSYGFNEWSHGNGRIQRSDISSFHSNQRGTQEFNDEVDEVALTAYRQPNIVIECSKSSQERKSSNTSLILFEDVDIIFDEDRGLMATILQLAETTKRPMILTCNSKDPSLPNLLGRSVLNFKLPSLGELLSGVHMVCAAEKIKISDQLLERFIWYSQGDIRKTIMLLQFWWQGGQGQEGSEKKCTYDPLPFDVDAGHLILPKMISWGFPCDLSIQVEKEISRALTLLKKKEFHMHTSGFVENGSKKEEMLRRNSTEEDFTDFPSQSDSAGGFSVRVADTTSAGRSGRYKLRAVLSSDSEDDSLPMSKFPSGDSIKDLLPLVAPHGQQYETMDQNIAVRPFLDDDLLPSVSGHPSSNLHNDVLPDLHHEHNTQNIEALDDLEKSTGQKGRLLMNESEQNHINSCETTTVGFSCGTRNLLDESCVPESSLVPETEIVGEEFLSRVASSCCRVLSNDDDSTVQSQPTVEIDNPDKSLGVIESIENGLGWPGEGGTVSALADEPEGAFLLDNVETETRAYQVMDECSRIDFNVGITLAMPPNSASEANLVQEAWKNLRDRKDLKSYVTSEQRIASHVMELASEFTDLISETDVLLSFCQPPINDNIEPSTVPFEEPEYFSWYDEHVEMTSTFAQHGFCLYAKKTAALGSNLGCHSNVDLAREMLAYSTNSMALGKLVRHEDCRSEGSALQSHSLRSRISSQREKERMLYNAISPIVPPRLHLALKGAAFHDYFSSLNQISKSEHLRLLNGVDKARHPCRARSGRHYLSRGPLTLTPEEIDLLKKHFSFEGSPPESICR